MSLLKRNIILLFTLVFLFLSSGVSYYESFCNDGCATELSLFEAVDSCCEDSSKNEDSCHNDEEEHAEHEDDCCGVEQISMEMDVDMENNPVFAFNCKNVDIHTELFYVYNTNLDDALLLSTDQQRGPPLPVKSGRVLLLEKNTFLI